MCDMARGMASTPAPMTSKKPTLEIAFLQRSLPLTGIDQVDHATGPAGLAHDARGSFPAGCTPIQPIN